MPPAEANDPLCTTDHEASPRPAGPDGTRSRVEGDKRIVLENYGERQEGQHLGRDDQEEAGGNVSTQFSLFSGQHYRK